MAETAELTMNDAITELAASREQLAHFKDRYDEMHADHAALETAHAKLIEQHASLQAAYDAALAQMPPAPKAYEYAEGECKPVTMIAGETCPDCGWVYAGKRPEDREPHPIKA